MRQPSPSTEPAREDHAASRSADPENPSGRAAWVRLGALLGILAVAIVITIVLGPPDVPQLRARLDRAGPAAPALFVLLYALLTLLPLPKNVFAALAGVLFGLVWGTVVVLLAALLGAAAAFVLSRRLGREAVERLTSARITRLDTMLRGHGILAVIVIRLVPVLPFTAINYAAGLTSVRLRDYAIGTALGIVPGTISFVALGTYAITPGSWPFVLSVATLAFLTVGGLVFARRHRHHGRNTPTAPTTAPTDTTAATGTDE